MLADLDPQIAVILGANAEDVPPNDEVADEMATDPEVEALVAAD